jgi:hypothetical protein
VPNHECSIEQFRTYSLDAKPGCFLDAQVAKLLILGRNRVDECKSSPAIEQQNFDRISSDSRSRIARDNRSLF